MNALTVGTSKIHQIDGLYSLNDLHKAAGGEKKHEPFQFFRNEQTQALMDEINSANLRSLRTIPGRNGGTYACRELMIAYATWISPAFHLKVIRVFLGTISPPAAFPAPPFDWGAAIEAANVDLKEPLPLEVQEAIDARAWVLMPGVHSLLRRHIERRVGESPARALEIVEQTSLLDAIAPAHHEKIRTALGLLDAMIAVAHKALRDMHGPTQRENMPCKELIAIAATNLNGETVPTVNARDLHASMNPPLKVIPGMYWFAGTGPDGEYCVTCAHGFNASSPVGCRRSTKIFCDLVRKKHKHPPKLDKLTPAYRYWEPRKDSRYG